MCELWHLLVKGIAPILHKKPLGLLTPTTVLKGWMLTQHNFKGPILPNKILILSLFLMFAITYGIGYPTDIEVGL
jgi:hypothetical protein